MRRDMPMSENRIHRARSADGTEIAGRVFGDGPPLVLVQPPGVDPDIAFEALLPHLAERFTCYLPSIRGRGPSGDNPDHSPPRLQEDINAFVDSIAEPVCLTGWSDGASLALGAGAHSDAVVAVAPFEPSVWPLMGEEDLSRQVAMLEKVGAAVARANWSKRHGSSTATSATRTSSMALMRRTWNGKLASGRCCCKRSSRAWHTRVPTRLTPRCSERSMPRSWFYWPRKPH